MKITFDILIYILKSRVFLDKPGETGRLIAERRGAADRETAHIRLYSSEITLHSDTLYLLSPEQLDSLLLRRGEEPLSLLLVTGADGGKLPDRLRGADNAALCRTELSLFALAERLQDRVQELLRWDAAFSEGVLKQKSADTLLAMACPFLDRDYAVVDIDMNVAYGTPGYLAGRGVRNERIPDELFQDLVAHREFHEAAAETGSFYYYTAQADSDNLCRNIRVNGQYIARLVLVLLPGEKELPEGARQLFESFADHIQDVYSHLNLLPERRAGEHIRALCRALLSGEEAERAGMERVLSSFGWADGHRFTCTVLRFSAGSGWDAQLLTMLPYLAASLERLWSGGCAVPIGDEIYLIVDHDAAGNAGDRQSLLQRLAYFVRDNVCKAGISPEFTRFAQLRAAGKAAAAALDIGSARRPDLWYYRFDDCRLAYCVAALGRELPGSMLCHPALGLLREHDRTRGTSLEETLRAYLDCNLNLTAASEKLYIHRTSFCRRMNQIRRLTGLDLDDADTVFLLQLSYRIAGEETGETSDFIQ